MEVEKSYWQTEVGIIPKDWDTKLLSELSDKIMVGIASAATHAYRDKGVILLRNQNIKSNFLDDSDILYISEEYESLFKNKRLKAGDLLTARTGYPGTTCLVPERHESSQSFTTLITRPNTESIDSKYLCYYLNSEKGQSFFEANQIGGGQKNVNAGTLKVMPIPVPPVKEQIAIATALSDTDALISTLENLIAKKRNIKQGVMQELLRPKKGWEVKKLTDVITYIHGKAHEQDIVEDGRFVVINSKFISTEGRVVKYSNVSHCTARQSDVLTVLSDLPNGRALAKCYYVDETGKYAVNQRICIWRSKGANPKFLFYLLNRNKYFLALDDGVSQTHILNKHIEACVIKLPKDVFEQEEIGRILWEIDNEIEAFEKKLEKIKAIKQGMMQNLLTGKIRLV
jgi:type I restriction enzyme S subunit